MLLLASASARRTDLLDLINIKHKVVEQDFDESLIIESDPIECSKLIVKGKNQSARSLLNDNDLENPVLTADTLVFSPDKKIYGKPKKRKTQSHSITEAGVSVCDKVLRAVGLTLLSLWDQVIEHVRFT